MQQRLVMLRYETHTNLAVITEHVTPRHLTVQDNPVLPPGSLILVTGASGYIESHVVNEALLAGYRVRGTARTRDRCDQTERFFRYADVVKVIKEVRPRAPTVATPPDDEPRDLSEVPNEQGAELLKGRYGQKTGYKPFIQTIEESLDGHEQ